jgi:hypothetical protein
MYTNCETPHYTIFSHLHRNRPRTVHKALFPETSSVDIQIKYDYVKPTEYYCILVPDAIYLGGQHLKFQRKLLPPFFVLKIETSNTRESNPTKKTLNFIITFLNLDKLRPSGVAYRLPCCVRWLQLLYSGSSEPCLE